MKIVFFLGKFDIYDSPELVSAADSLHSIHARCCSLYVNNTKFRDSIYNGNLIFE